MTNIKQRKYSGSIEALQAAVAGTGAVGNWTARSEPRLHTFRSNAGDIVNWWPRTKTLQFQGRMSSDFVQGVVDDLGASVHQTKPHAEPLAMLL